MLVYLDYTSKYSKYYTISIQYINNYFFMYFRVYYSIVVSNIALVTKYGSQFEAGRLSSK